MLNNLGYIIKDIMNIVYPIIMIFACFYGIYAASMVFLLYDYDPKLSTQWLKFTICYLIVMVFLFFVDGTHSFYKDLVKKVFNRIIGGGGE